MIAMIAAITEVFFSAIAAITAMVTIISVETGLEFDHGIF